MQQQSRSSPAPTSLVNNSQNKTATTALSQPQNGRLGSVDSNNSDPESLKRERDSGKAVNEKNDFNSAAIFQIPVL